MESSNNNLLLCFHAYCVSVNTVFIFIGPNPQILTFFFNFNVKSCFCRHLAMQGPIVMIIQVVLASTWIFSLISR